MSRKIIFTYLVIYQSVTVSSVKETRIFEGTFAEVYKMAKSSCPRGFIIRDIRVL
nr:MAG TPA: hypothetical protein [Microviridae sp.]